MARQAGLSVDLAERLPVCTAATDIVVEFFPPTDRRGTGERFGLIRFGSRVDVYMPDNAVPLVGLGSKAIAGETILADLSSTEPRRSYKVG